MKNSAKIGAFFIGFIMVATLIILSLCFEKVPAGYVGVVYKPSTGVAQEILTQGWHFLEPADKVTEYSIGIEQSYLTASKDGDSPDNDSFSAPSSDGKGLQMELTFTYRFDEKCIADTFTRFKGRSGKELLSVFIKPNVISWTKEVTAKYPVSDVLGEKRAELNNELSIYLSQKFLPYGIIIENASLINIEVDNETRQAINKKVNAIQELELVQTQAKTAQVEAEKDKNVALVEAEKEKEVAVLNAQKAKIKAEGEAEALKIRAEAEAEANKKLSESLTKELIEKTKIEKWNGDVPQVQGSSSTIVSLNEKTQD